MILDQNHDTTSGHQQSLCDTTSNVSPLENYIADTNYVLFLPVTLNLTLWEREGVKNKEEKKWVTIHIL